MADQSQFSEPELARLADGSLLAPREVELRAQVGASPRLAAALAEQKRAMSLLRAVDEAAPASLRARIDGLTSASTPQRTRPRRRWTPAFGGATALAIATAAVVTVAAGGTTAPTLSQTVRLALGAATMRPPSIDARDPDQLQLRVGGIAFPNRSGFEASGARADTVGGRRVATVFYLAQADTPIGYAIVSGPPLAVAGGRVVQQYRQRYTEQQHGLTRVVTWQQSGHTCVIAARSVGYGALLALAISAQLGADPT